MANDTPLGMANELIEKHEDIYPYRTLAIEHAILTANIMIEQLYRVDFYRIDDGNLMIGYWTEVKKLLENPLTEYKL